MLTDAGYEIERLDKPHATEDELVEAVRGKDGYILGGIEDITEKIIDAGDKLKAIVFTGIGYKDHIPAWQYATQKSIAIANTPSAPTHAVSEWVLAMTLAMNRGIFDLGRAGKKEFMTTKGIEGQHVGIIGYGHIGKHLAEMLPAFRPASISYYSRSTKNKELPTLLAESDIIFLCVSKDAGENFMDKEKLAQIKDGALLVSFMASGIIDEVALLAELTKGRIRAASDVPMKADGFKNLPLSIWYCFNGSNAFNTTTELKLTSDMAAQSMINLLKTGRDQNRVN